MGKRHYQASEPCQPCPGQAITAGSGDSTRLANRANQASDLWLRPLHYAVYKILVQGFERSAEGPNPQISAQIRLSYNGQQVCTLSPNTSQQNHSACLLCCPDAEWGLTRDGVISRSGQYRNEGVRTAFPELSKRLGGPRNARLASLLTEPACGSLLLCSCS